MKNSLLLFLPILLFFNSCIPNEPAFDGFTRNELQQILSNKNEKKWSLNQRFEQGNSISLNECEPIRQLIFNYTTDSKQNDSLFYISPYGNCESLDTLKGIWSIPERIDKFLTTDTLILQWEDNDAVYFKLEEVSPALIQISTMESDSLTEVFEQFDEAGLD